MSRHPLAFTAALFVAYCVITGCASLGLEPAQSFSEKLAYAVSQNAAVRNTAAVSLKAGDITAEDAQSVLKLTDEARTLMDAARIAADVGDLSTAEARLSVATAILVNLQTFLRERGKS